MGLLKISARNVDGWACCCQGRRVGALGAGRTVFTASERLDVDCFLSFAVCLGNCAREVLFIGLDDLCLLHALAQHADYNVFVGLLLINGLIAVNGFGSDLGAWDTEQELVVAGGGEHAKAVLRLRLFWYRQTDTVVDIVVSYAELCLPSGGTRAPDCTGFTVSTDLQLELLALRD